MSGELEVAVPFGGTDTKLANLEMLHKVTAIVKAGPTNQMQPTFTWNDWNHTYHRGLPISYDFEWTVMSPSLCIHLLCMEACKLLDEIKIYSANVQTRN